MDNKYIKRDIFKDLWAEIDRKEIVFLIGPRQSGKTTLMKRLQYKLDGMNEKTLFLSLDFEYDRQYFSSQQDLLKKIALESGGKKCFVFIDEIQRKKDAGLFLKGIYDMSLPYKFIVSGSGSIDLKTKVRESMTGRKRVYELHTVSLKEFVNFKTDYRYENNLEEFFSVEKARLQELLTEYMNFGGYPAVILEAEFKEKLRAIDEIFRSYMEKDIVYLLKVEKLDEFGNLIKVLADQSGKHLNHSELSNTLGISLPTLKNYFWYAENTYIVSRVSPFFRNVRSEITKSPVAYFYDIGLRNYALQIFGSLNRPDDMGFVFQNIVFMVLTEKLRWSNAKIHHWRTKTGSEIDFVVESGREIVPVEVKYSDLAKPLFPRAFEGFIEKYQPARCFVVNKRLNASVTIKGCEITFLTIWDLIQTDIFRNQA